MPQAVSSFELQESVEHYDPDHLQFASVQHWAPVFLVVESEFRKQTSASHLELAVEYWHPDSAAHVSASVIG